MGGRGRCLTSRASLGGRAAGASGVRARRDGAHRHGRAHRARPHRRGASERRRDARPGRGRGASIDALAQQLGAPADRIARAIIAAADAAVARALRRVSVERGIDPRRCALVAFGGGGPLHACALANQLGMTPHPHSAARRRAERARSGPGRGAARRDAERHAPGRSARPAGPRGDVRRARGTGGRRRGAPVVGARAVRGAGARARRPGHAGRRRRRRRRQVRHAAFGESRIHARATGGDRDPPPRGIRPRS